MLQLKNIKKDYLSGEETVHALKGLTLNFRENEFVSILGQSGCGKTTLLNIVGGLDRYTSGDLVINGKSTKEFKDRDWDTYRNHSIGFVFQSYNLIPHQSVLSNVELALTLSGVSKAERRRRAKEALEKVGLGDQLRKKPNQMSGGQMQRVAIARALVNNPDILLADEPTGALDSETSLQVMEILKEVAKDKLVIMVTHNPELAEKYSTRIIRLLDGEVVSDTMPYDGEEEVPAAKEQKAAKKPSMSFFTAFTLSLNNLMTKKGRTILTAFAGSIGIIGIALIMSLSNGVQSYIDKMEEDTLTSYPITIEQASVDMTSMMTSMMSVGVEDHEPGKVYSSDIMASVMDSMFNQLTANDLKSFKAYLDEGDNDIVNLTSEIQYTYNTQIGVFTTNVAGELQQVNPSNLLGDIGLTMIAENMENMNNSGMGGMMSSQMDVFHELIGNQDMLDSDYELLEGNWPENYNEVVLVVDNNYSIADYFLYCLGVLDKNDLKDAFAEMQKQMLEDGSVDMEVAQAKAAYDYEELMGMDLRLVLPTDYYVQNEQGVWVDMSDDENYMENLVENAETLKVVGVVRSTSETNMTYGSIGYTPALTEYVIHAVEGSAIVRQQMADPDTDVFTGLPFPDTEAALKIKEEEAAAGEETATLSQEQKAMLEETIAAMPAAYAGQLAALSEEEQASMLIEYGVLDQGAFDALASDGGAAPREKKISDSTYDANINLLHAVNLDEPSTINLYCSSFEEKEALTDALDAYNDRQTAEGHEEKVIRYTDYVGLLMSSVTNIVDIISYVLIAFVGISLVVSSIMIGVITLISVQERTKEIGILRSIGASKKDISRVFNAETLIIGLAAGLLGIGVTLVLNVPINMIICNLTGIKTISKLPAVGGSVLVVISVLLTMLAGLIPSKTAARKDPVEALRTE